MKKTGLIIFLGIALVVISLEAVTPRRWELRSIDDYIKGKLDGISVSYEGTLFLAPNEEKVDGPSEDFYLSFVQAEDGTSFLGTGHGGKIYRFPKDGKPEIYFQATEMDITCMALDHKGTLYAGTSPNGKIYKISGKDKQEKFFDPGEKYIWDLVLADDGFLMAAVGESGGIYKISPQGEGQQILKAEENHILCLKKGEKGDLIAGSGGVGVVYRITSGGRTIVLFESPFEEIKSVVIDEDGGIYAAAGGSPSRTKKDEATEPLALGRIATELTVTPGAAAPLVRLPVISGQKEPSALYRIRPDGMAKKVWESSDELIYTLLWREAEKKLVFGTGNKGRVYEIAHEDKTSLLLQSSSEQVYALVPSGSKVYALANNPSRLEVISSVQRSSGEYVSDVLDGMTVSSWGRIEFDGTIPAGTTLQVQTRSGNSFEPNSLWSDWSPPIQKTDEQILSPKARYLQFKVLFRSQTGNVSPLLQRIGLYYLQTNIAPQVKKLVILPPNEVYLKPPDQDEIIWGLEDISPAKEEKKREEKAFYTPKKAERKGYQTVTWEASDENEDELTYSLYIKKEGETSWRLVKDRLTDSVFAFDTLTFPDGSYFFRLQASDLPSNPTGLELKAEKTSPPFIIDHSLPVITGFSVAKDKGELAVAFQAEDSFSSIEKVEYLIRPGLWRVVFPVDGICDSRKESFKFSVPLPPNADSLISVRVTDRHHNIGVFRQTF